MLVFKRCLFLLLKPFVPESVGAMAKLCRLSSVAPILLRRCTGVLPKREYGSAAAVQLDYDYSDYEEEDEYEVEVYRKLAKTESEGCVSGRGVHWVIIGEPGAKKHVYAEKLSKLLHVPHISIGTLVRQELSPNCSVYKLVISPTFVPFLYLFGICGLISCFC